MFEFSVEGGDRYRAEAVPAHPDVARVAFRVSKLVPNGNCYDVRQAWGGACECECLGWLRWGHCRHVTALLSAGVFAGEGP